MNFDFSGKVGPDEVKNLMNNLSAEQRDKLNAILKDKAATEQILSSPKAQQLLKALLGGEKNG